MDCSPPGSSVHGTLQERMLEWAAVPSSRGSSPPRDQTQVSCLSCTGKRVFWPQAPPGKTHKYLLLWKRELDKEQPGQRCPIPVEGTQPQACCPAAHKGRSACIYLKRGSLLSHSAQRRYTCPEYSRSLLPLVSQVTLSASASGVSRSLLCRAPGLRPPSLLRAQAFPHTWPTAASSASCPVPCRELRVVLPSDTPQIRTPLCSGFWLLQCGFSGKAVVLQHQRPFFK